MARKIVGVKKSTKVNEAPIVEETVAVEKTDVVEDKVTEEVPEISDNNIVTESQPDTETVTTEDNISELVFDESILEVNDDIMPIDWVDSVNTDPEHVIEVDYKKQALEAIKQVENPDDRFIQDVCNILKITRLKKSEPKKNNRIRNMNHKRLTDNMWKW